ncbi:hypothetical protein [Terasakiella sp.]|uniref:hypothetical protein n=1 Tax=Terasakiella sp. TaxID=2034861 RepID=UPI003AA9156F
MTASELIEKLKQLPQDARVFHLWDGEPRTEINEIWLSKRGHIVTSDFSQVCYSTAARPVDAPDEKTAPYWRTPQNPNYKMDDEDDYDCGYPWD